MTENATRVLLVNLRKITKRRKYCLRHGRTSVRKLLGFVRHMPNKDFFLLPVRDKIISSTSMATAGENKGKRTLCKKREKNIHLSACGSDAAAESQVERKMNCHREVCLKEKRPPGAV